MAPTEKKDHLKLSRIRVGELFGRGNQFSRPVRRAIPTALTQIRAWYPG